MKLLKNGIINRIFMNSLIIVRNTDYVICSVMELRLYRSMIILLWPSIKAQRLLCMRILIMIRKIVVSLVKKKTKELFTKSIVII